MCVFTPCPAQELLGEKADRYHPELQVEPARTHAPAGRALPAKAIGLFAQPQLAASPARAKAGTLHDSLDGCEVCLYRW